MPLDPLGRTGRTFVVLDLGCPVRGRRGYRALGTVVAPSRAGARTLVDACGYAQIARGPVRAVSPRAAGTGLLMQALGADGRRLA